MLKTLSPSKGKVKIIDLLSGMGETWQSTIKWFPNSELSALDFSEGMLKYAANKSEKYFKNEVKIFNQNLLNNNLKSEYYDIVICAFGLKTFNNEQIKILASETNRILKKGGQFSFVEVSKPENKFLIFLYRFYLGKIIPILGKIMLGNFSEYKMLWKYTTQFNNAKEACSIFTKSGLKTNYKSYFGGCASGFYGKKIFQVETNS